MRKEIREAIAESIENFPESSYPFDWFDCTGWGYEKFEFKFNALDPKSNNFEHKVIDDRDKWIEAGEALALLHYMDKVFYYGWDPMDGGSYDAEVVAGIVQMYWFGEVHFG